MIRRIVCAINGHGKSFKWVCAAYYRCGSRFIKSSYTRYTCCRCGQDYIVKGGRNV